jgi:hypothetical protein
VTATFAIVIVFAEVWLLAHGRAIAAAVLAALVLPLVLFALRRDRRSSPPR